MNSVPRVLVVDQSADCREVLRTLLERHGAATIEARRPDQAIRLAGLVRPDLIVFDAESDHSDRGTAGQRLAVAASRTDTPIVILGRVPHTREKMSFGEFVDKPYHYGLLIRKIRALLPAA